jgi:hypothetical protein
MLWLVRVSTPTRLWHPRRVFRCGVLAIGLPMICCYSPEIVGCDITCTDRCPEGMKCADNGLCRPISGNTCDRPIAVWEFGEGMGEVVHDTSGTGDPLDLQIDGATTWIPGALRIDSATTILDSRAPATKIFDAVTATNQLTVEAWVVPVDLFQTGPARIVSCSGDVLARNFHLAQAETNLEGRIRTTTTGIDGSTPVLIGGSLTGARDHLVMTHSVDSSRRLYINGGLVAADLPGGTLADWNRSFALQMANETSKDRGWLGELHRVTIFNVTLSAEEIVERFEASLDEP